MYKVLDILVEASQKVIDFDSSIGMPAGHNGPYDDKETPVRNTSHWLITFCYLYKYTGENCYKDAALKALEYLMSRPARPMGGSFYIRKNPKKDFCNGVMGQAWVIESLIIASKILNRPDAYDLAEQVFLLHPFDESRGVWLRVAVDGSHMSEDVTFNHQLWFAAISLELDRTPGAIDCGLIFFKKHAESVELYPNGVIYHGSRIKKFREESKKGLKSIIDFIIEFLYSKKRKKSLFQKSVGYHGFNLYAYARIYKKLPELKFFQSNKYSKMLEVTLSSNFIDALRKSPYAYPYNPPGIEIAYALSAAGYDLSVIHGYLKEHFNLTFNRELGEFNTLLSTDKVTSAARLYELALFLDEGVSEQLCFKEMLKL
jgi:hypothetical protein